MDDKELAAFKARIAIKQRLKDDFEHYAVRCLKIRAKTGQVLPLELNKAQKYTHAKLEEQKGRTGKVRALVLKGRQQGMSTYIGARFYHRVTWNKGQQAFILTHALDATNNLYQMAKRYYEHTPDAIKLPVTKSNAKELIFGCLESGYKLGTAENKKVGRSSTIQLLHGSETAFWNNAADHATGIMQAVPNAPGTEIILESTANGVGNYFHQMWQDAEAGISEFVAIFVPWFWQDEYVIEAPEFIPTPDEQLLMEGYGLTHEQLAWRRRKIIELSVNGVDGLKAFQQEYPCNPVEAFQLTGEDNFIVSDIVLSARKTVDVEKVGPLLLGVDPARMGDDRTAIIRRQGRCAFKLETHTKLDTMQVTGLVKTIIEAEKPQKVFIDIGGLGAGVYDRLRELVSPDLLVAVNFGARPYDAQKYKNKKAEMWGLMNEWLNEFPCSIPDSDELHADLTGAKYAIDSNSRLIIESKESMKKRGIRSSDTSDALCLTFAMPDSAIHASIKKQQTQVLQSLGESMAKRRQLLERSRFK